MLPFSILNHLSAPHTLHFLVRYRLNYSTLYIYHANVINSENFQLIFCKQLLGISMDLESNTHGHGFYKCEPMRDSSLGTWIIGDNTQDRAYLKILVLNHIRLPPKALGVGHF
ncbi:MAG: hypothetical protein EA411_11530 [Saprospirales bacterium]|nr:MAG: hypothetical protein EA411_11530 [Saprospirales bacterium]